MAAIALAACATLDRDLFATRQSWQGVSYDEVVARWGAPARSEGKDSHTWVSEGVPWRGGPSVGVGVFGGGSSGVGIGASFPIGQPEPLSRCERTLVFRDGRVAEQAWLGPADYCTGFRRN